ncbi:hypothetical protein JCM19053_3885 [Vibrio sp. JCM 19053]|nr:hypothetical protein JCM19053_3885 [Vibrio sp. JCM 19053]
MKRRKLDENLLLLARFYRIMLFHLVHHFFSSKRKDSSDMNKKIDFRVDALHGVRY